MSDAEEFIEELDVEKISVEEVELIELLNSFGITETIIEAFLVNSYTIETLKVIQRQEIELLIPPPSLTERTKFIHQLDIWRTAQGLPKIQEVPASGSSSASVLDTKVRLPSEPRITRDLCTATYLLNNSSKGQAIIRKYSQTPFLSRSDKKSITHIVVDEFKNRFSKLTSSELLERSKELKQKAQVLQDLRTKQRSALKIYPIGHHQQASKLIGFQRELLSDTLVLCI